MPGVHGLEHIHDLGAPDLTHNNAIRTHPQTIADQFSLADLPFAFDVGRTGLQADDIMFLQLEFGGVLHRHDALV